MKTDISAELVRALLDYDPLTGVFVWNARIPEMFKSTEKRSASHICANWNSWKAGKVAGQINPLGYGVIELFNDPYFAHRLAWIHYYGEWPKQLIDHVNLNPSDNRITNLREATHSQNLANRRQLRSNVLKGAYFSARLGKWQSKLSVGGNNYYLGLFATEEEAHLAYSDAARSHFGEFWRSK